ncbi:ATPase family AAA domain-containing protein 2-like [Salarias fasciatus]|uniref:ATPase family AAA domain-containing protein 2-like n=1 Tax=Salarias fasciatus TaxID=181472 RepID=UPI0011770843|nr:ATPase family AAA domain-containing protein 2-like [Salarias fasciatus]
MSKSPRLPKPSGGGRRRRRLRRSSRATRPTSRFQASSTMDSARSALKRRSREEIDSRSDGKVDRRSTSDSDDSASVGGERPAHGGHGGQNGAVKLNRAPSLYQEPSNNVLRGTFRICASGRNAARRGAYRTAKWSNQTDDEDEDEDEDDDSEDDDGNTALSCRPLRSGLVPSQKSSGGPADIEPMSIDQSVGFDSIGGLSGHISALKEMVVFPLLYPEVFDNFKIQPPRGCLFYGPPGTGKTLVARALANECRHGNRRVSFFMRKGADCLSKWVGESERQLRLLFEQAYMLRPSIIFFDEIDGLAPVRSSRQDQIHSSMVSTLLALMDGLDSRGEVVVIGATNRLDSIDPALRRPGRFDREFLFGLPDRESRKEILKIHTRQWTPCPSEDFLEELAARCVGYCGADIRAVCTEAALCALRRRYPQIYGSPQKLLLDVSSIAVGAEDFAAAMMKMSPASRRSNASPAKPLSAVVEPLLGGALRDALAALRRLFPHAAQGARRRAEPDLTSGVHDDGLMSADGGAGTTNPSGTRTRNLLHFTRSAVKQPMSHRPRMLLVGRPDSGQTSHLAPAILHALERFPVHSLDSAVLFGAGSSSPEEACAQRFSEARRTSPSVLYVPHIQQWWDTVGPALRASFLSLLAGIPSFSPVLLLATCSVPHEQLDPEIQSLFREEYGEVYTLGVPSQKERSAFFQDLLLNQAAEPPPPDGDPETGTLEVLPPAPLPPPHQLSQQERLHLEEQEEDVLRELRLLLRNVTERLILDRRFRAFSRPLDLEEVPDYLLVTQTPMDLSTLLTNIDQHKYSTVGDFLSDADLIWKNALESTLDGGLRHRACALRDAVRAAIRDQLDPDLERVCEEIQEARFKRGHESQEESRRFSSSGSQLQKKKRYKRPRKTKWSTGVLPKPKKKKLPAPPSPPSLCSSSSSSSSFTSSSELSTGSSSSQSDSSDEEEEQDLYLSLHPAYSGVPGGPGGTLKNGFLHPKELHPRSNQERTRRGEAAASTQQGEKNQRPLLVDRSKLRDLLTRCVSQTEGFEVEALEKLYALLAQCIYTHREESDKSPLLQDMRTEIDCFF